MSFRLLVNLTIIFSCVLFGLIHLNHVLVLKIIIIVLPLRFPLFIISHDQLFWWHRLNRFGLINHLLPGCLCFTSIMSLYEQGNIILFFDLHASQSTILQASLTWVFSQNMLLLLSSRLLIVAVVALHLSTILFRIWLLYCCYFLTWCWLVWLLVMLPQDWKGLLTLMFDFKDIVFLLIYFFFCISGNRLSIFLKIWQQRHVVIVTICDAPVLDGLSFFL